MPVIPALERLKKEDLGFETRLVYIAKACLKIHGFLFVGGLVLRD
jgi:hypothetical protein